MSFRSQAMSSVDPYRRALSCRYPSNLRSRPLPELRLERRDRRGLQRLEDGTALRAADRARDRVDDEEAAGQRRDEVQELAGQIRLHAREPLFRDPERLLERVLSKSALAVSKLRQTSMPW